MSRCVNNGVIGVGRAALQEGSPADASPEDISEAAATPDLVVDDASVVNADTEEVWLRPSQKKLLCAHYKPTK